MIACIVSALNSLMESGKIPKAATPDGFIA